MPTDTIKWIEINWKVLNTINDNRSIIGSTEDAYALFCRANIIGPSITQPKIARIISIVSGVLDILRCI
jgi:hypothetical protein